MSLRRASRRSQHPLAATDRLVPFLFRAFTTRTLAHSLLVFPPFISAACTCLYLLCTRYVFQRVSSSSLILIHGDSGIRSSFARNESRSRCTAREHLIKRYACPTGCASFDFRREYASQLRISERAQAISERDTRWFR